MSPRDKKTLVTTRMAASVPGTFTTLLLAGAIVAFGANAGSFIPTSDQGSPAHEPADKAAPDPKPTTKSAPEAEPFDEPIAFPTQKAKPIETTKPKPEPAEQAKPKPTEQSKPKPTEQAKPAPVTSVLALEGWQKDGKVKLAWKPFSGTGFEYYKVVRSTDATVNWPAGHGDEVIGAIGDVKATAMAHHPPCGKAFWYAVFAVRPGDGGYQVLAISNVVSLKAECLLQATPKEKDTGPMGFDVQAKPGTGIKLAWTKFGGDEFAAYKIVRSQTNADPQFPVSDGTELVAAIGDRYQTYFLDTDVAPGETWFYRVVAVDGGHAALKQTGSLAAIAE